MSRVAHPWEASYPPECRWDAPIAQGTLPGFLDKVAARYGDAPALGYRGDVLSYAEVKRLSDRVAAALMAMGIGRGDCVALYLPNTPWHPICFFAALRTGARVTHLSALDAKRELAHKVRDSGATLLITTGFAPLLENAAWLRAEGAVARVLLAPEARWNGEDFSNDFPLLPEAEPTQSWPAIVPDDVALLQYTGGTTGTPKGAMLTHGNLTAAISIYKAWRDRATIPEGQGRCLVLLPLFHIFALTAVLLRQMSEGHLCHLRPRFDAAQAVEEFRALRITTFSGVPTMWIGILNMPGVTRAHFATLRQASSGGAPMPFEVQQKLETLVGLRIGGGWGMTETCPAGTRIPPDAPRRAGLIGLPLPGIELRIVDPDNPTVERAVGEVGEMAVRGPNVFSGYWNRPAEENARAFADGWFLTGDMGWMDERGHFTLVDRRKNMILSGGFNVYPAQIEQAIYEHPDVAECIVIGVPDAYRGQAAKAYVALKQGARGFTLEELRTFLADRLGKHGMPAALEIRDNLPRSAAGKLLASALRDENRE
ncbi:dicarboxylate--CoA ligase PimA [Falsiroseomonas bella]|uniref:Long-chain-fatty-acid--CoA ligase n=1 Tax=Falsiroseomonas bella TaxID=2184016 RepID=A0A317FG21_9PROT|nr:AMP-binding protein [Falsiroseomonas bella]PWS36486.1 dicarboxylate--CoA ligase PimA [Falsiroseomonas bella]